MHNIIDVFEGLRLIRLPLPFELNHVNVGLVRLAGGYMLIDTGMDTEESFEVLSASLSGLGVQWRDIRRVLITHMHPDHVGLLGRVLALSGATLLMHRDEVAHLNMIVDAGQPPWIDVGLRLAGTPEPMVQAIHSSLKHLRDALRTVRAGMSLAGGEELETAAGPARVLFTPGHTVGHVCLYWPGRRALYAADLMIEHITPNISWLPDRDCLSEYLASLDSLRDYDIEVIVPSHGLPFRGHREWIAQTFTHHEERCAKLLAAIRRKPESAHHLLPVLWDRHLSPFHYHFALFEVLAHLEHMRRKGSLSAEEQSDGAVRWILASGAATG